MKPWQSVMTVLAVATVFIPLLCAGDTQSGSKETLKNTPRYLFNDNVHLSDKLGNPHKFPRRKLSAATAGGGVAAAEGQTELNEAISFSELPATPDFYSAVEGVLYGAAIGDSMGGQLEFSEDRRTFSWDMAVEQASKFEYPQHKQAWKLRPYEITDDTSMAMCLARGLAETPVTTTPGRDDEEVKLSDIRRHVFNHYYEWANLPPFDIGGTTRQAFKQPTVDEAAKDVKAMDDEARWNYGNGILSNGALMRIMPLIPYCWRFDLNKMEDIDQIYRIVKTDTYLTNHNVLSSVANTAYVVAGVYLIKTAGIDTVENRALGAYQKAIEWLEYVEARYPIAPGYRTNLAGLESEFHVPVSKRGDQFLVKNAATQVLEWLRPTELPWHKFERHDQFQLEVAPSDFLIPVALQSAFWYLRHAWAYDDSIIHVLKMATHKSGLDTDTNACIVGGLMGALHGLDAIAGMHPEWVAGILDKNEPVQFRMEDAWGPSGDNHHGKYQAKWYGLAGTESSSLARQLINKAPVSIVE